MVKTKRKRFDKNKPGWKDGILRFRCPKTDLWRRYEDTMVGSKGPTKGWDITGETMTDDIGEYVLTSNGSKIYTFPRPVRAEMSFVPDPINI